MHIMVYITLYNYIMHHIILHYIILYYIEKLWAWPPPVFPYSLPIPPMALLWDPDPPTPLFPSHSSRWAPQWGPDPGHPISPYPPPQFSIFAGPWPRACQIMVPVFLIVSMFLATSSKTHKKIKIEQPLLQENSTKNNQKSRSSHNFCNDQQLLLFLVQIVVSCSENLYTRGGLSGSLGAC